MIDMNVKSAGAGYKIDYGKHVQLKPHIVVSDYSIC